jgi:hypothetical protein
MHTSDPTVDRAVLVAPSTISRSSTAYWILRIGAALCFIGHGAFGFITKAAWLNYFAVVGIPEAWAWRLMPLVGTVDVLVGMAVLFAPRGLPLLYMSVWATWTALLRPLSGESIFETLERAGNYGVPLALMVLTAMPRSSNGLVRLLDRPAQDERVLPVVRHILKWTTCLLLLGHGALGVASKPMLTDHYAAVGLPPDTTVWLGWIEISLAIAAAVRPVAALLLFIATWKIATESLFVVEGAPIWEFIERAGSYAAPLALAVLSQDRRRMQMSLD